MYKKSLLCLGYGYCAKYICHELASQNWSCAGTYRSEKPTSVPNVRFLPFTTDAPPTEAFQTSLTNATHLLISTAPSSKGDPIYLWLKKYALHLPNLRWLGYFSATSVYGDHQGRWVDETTPPTPTTDRGANRLLAEQQWQHFQTEQNCTLALLRLSGIYGAGRSAFERLNTSTKPLIHKENQYFSRIHVQDIARQTAYLLSHDLGGLFNYADTLPCNSVDPILYAASLLKMPPPHILPFEEGKTQLSEFATKFFLDNKRIRADKITNTTKIPLLYPSYKEGLSALHADGIKEQGS